MEVTDAVPARMARKTASAGRLLGYPPDAVARRRNGPVLAGQCPLLTVAAEHDPQPLPDVQVNGPAAVRLGDGDFPARCGRAWRWG